MKKILIIEDDLVLGDVLVQKLQTAGYQTELVRDGAKGYTCICEMLPDLILLDVFLPIVNGIEVLHQKKENPAITNIPVLALSNSLNPASIADIKQMGIVDFMIKSDITTQSIIDKVRLILGDTAPAATHDAISHQLSVDVTADSFDILIGKRLLLVEDDTFLGSILSTRLRDKNVDVAYAATGEDALTELKKQKPDLVLLDVLLPGINGFEVLEVIRKDPETKDMHVIVLSNFSQVEDQKKATALGADFLVKALVNPDNILEKIVEVLGR
ncbi:MAG: response regulator [Patescibacteria group bacterium]